MAYTISPVFPRSISRAKSVAKHLSAAYPNRKLSICQATTAHLFGFKDWHALEEACKSKPPTTVGPFDGDIPSDDLQLRRYEQASIVCLELSNVDIDADHSRPAKQETKSSMTEEELLTMFADRALQMEPRLEKANARWSRLYALNVVDEICPTTKDVPKALDFSNLFATFKSDEVKSLPALLGRWWSVNIPHQKEVGDALKSFQLDPHSFSSLLRFGHYWGTLCVYYAETISWSMGMGVAYILAERYGSMHTQLSATWNDLITQLDDVDEASFEAVLPELLEIVNDAKLDYFEAYPRDDFADAFMKQPGAFEENAEEVIKILADPNSKRGTWDSVR